MSKNRFEADSELLLDRLVDRAGGLYAELQRVVEVFAGSGEAKVASDEISQLETTATAWRGLIPVDPAGRQALADDLWDRYGHRLSDCPAITAALGANTRKWSGPTPVVNRTLWSAFVRRELAVGETLFVDGADGTSLFVIARGRVRVVSGDGATTISELGADETVGEMAVITGEPRQGTVIAVRDTVLYELSKADFDHFRIERPAVAQQLLLTLARRMNAPPVRGRRKTAPTNIVIVPAGGEVQADAAQTFVQSFTDFVQRFVSAQLVTADVIDGRLGDGASTATRESVFGQRVDEHLRELEAANDLVMLLVDDDRPTWSRRLLAEADLVLVVGAAGRPPSLSAIEQELFNVARINAGSVEIQLVLVEADHTRIPNGTDAWRASRPVDLSHHGRLANPTDLGRLARFVVGQPCGLTLSGGAVRSLAHLGVLRALEEIAYPIDIVSGTSAGAFVAAQHAYGLRSDEMVTRNIELLGSSGLKFLDLTAPIISIISGRRYGSVLATLFDTTKIEDLWTPFLCTSTDLTSAEVVAHHTGPLTTYLLSSASIPGLLPPVLVEGHLLVDGGVMSNLPVTQLLDTTNVGVLIAASVTSTFYDANEEYNYAELSTRDILKAKFSPWSDPLVAPSVPDVLLRTFEIGAFNVELREQAMVDVLIQPDVAKFGYTNVGALREIAQAGYEAAVDVLETWDRPSIPFT